MLKRDKDAVGEGKAVVPRQPGRGVVVRDPWNEFDLVFDLFRRDMDSLFGYPTSALMVPRMRAMAGIMAPSVDVQDTGKELVLTADMPGLSKDDVRIEIDEKTVTIRAEQNVERKEEDEERCYLCQERGHRSVYRSLALPEAIDPENATAKVKDGVVTLTMPKAKPRKTVEVKVK